MPRLRQCFVVFLAVLCAVSAFGQGTTGSLIGTVTTEGAPLPGVTVTVTSPAMQGTRTTVTGESGGFTFPSLTPGVYTVTYELAGMQNATRRVTIALSSTARADADLRMSSVSEAITVTASAPAVLETTDIIRNFTQEEVQELPVRRNIVDTVSLAPGVNASGARNNISISGGMSFDNLFLVNGVTVNENLRGQPHNLFIEDAIQETTVTTGSVSAEYGRFTGGVVSAITKSGGNEFTGSFRDSFTNAAWIAKTPFRNPQGVGEADHPDKIAQVYEGTLGGYVMRDRLWFFLAGRHAAGAPAVGFDPTGSTVRTGITFQNTIDEDRWEGKLTAQILPQHSIVGSYLDVDTVETNNYFAPIYDEASIVRSRSLPNTLLALNYNGVMTSNLLVEAQYSKKEYSFVGSGGQFTDQIRGTWIQDSSNNRFNAPVFCGVCTPEGRNNDSFLAKATYFVNTRSLGTHSVVVGGEQFNEVRLVNNFQSASQYEIVSGNPVTITGTTIYPIFNANTRLRHRPILEESRGSDLTTLSYFINDKWDFNAHWNFNLGIRYDENDAIDASGNVVSDDSAFSPRIGAIYDILGDGRFRVNASYSHYVSKIVDGNVGGGAAGAGVPALFNYRYAGPVINAPGTPADQLLDTHAALAVMFNWFNALSDAEKTALLASSSIPGFTTQIQEPISSPFVREMVLGFGSQVTPNAYARIDFINRDWHDFYATRVDLTTGTFTAPNGARGDLAVLVNDDENITREYQGIQLNGTWRRHRFNVGGGYTWSRLTGNDLPEGDGTAAVTNTFGQFYPEYLNYENRQPEGYLNGDQRHRARVWAGYDVPFPIGQLNLTLLQTYESGRAYSAVGTVNAGPTGASPLTNPGYAFLSQIGDSHNYYFGGRGAFRTDDMTSTDLALNYSVPLSRVEIFFQGQALNVFNEDAVTDIYLSRMNTTVHTARSGGRVSDDPTSATLQPFNPRTETPVEGVHYRYHTDFGKAANKDGYQTPRTYRFSIGARF